ncbi:hypothetical protein BGZ95_006737, partial [Linnemannia exigua]
MRHGTTQGQAKSHTGTSGSNGNTSSLNLINASGTGNGISFETSDGSSGDDDDEEMEDARDCQTDGETLSKVLKARRPPDDKPSQETGPGFEMQSPLVHVQMNHGSRGSQLGLNSINTAVTSKGDPSSWSYRPKAKKLSAAMANDALDVISEYLLQNGQIGATKLPLVKHL